MNASNTLLSTLPVPESQFNQLAQVLREECPYVDREALGHWCGLNRPWWEVNSGYGAEDCLRLLRQLHTNEVPNIALRVASRTRLDDLGIMGYAMLVSPTLEQGLKLLTYLVEQSNPYLRISFDCRGEHALLSCKVLAAGSPYLQLLLESWLISAWRYIQVLLPAGVAACASFASLSYSAPTYHWQYQQLLGCRVTFDQETSVLAIPKQWLSIAIQGSSGQAQSLFETQIRRVLKDRQHSGDLISRVKRLLLERPSECRYSLEKTAPLMSLSPRTLRRYLAAADTSFRQVCLDTRMELARDYLLNTRLSAQEIAYQLGYSQPNNFYRAFKGVYGVPPERFRSGHTG
jgi:AraC-type DNA-binding domain-containing proteins